MKITKYFKLSMLIWCLCFSAKPFANPALAECHTHAPASLDQSDPQQSLELVLDALLSCLKKNKTKMGDIEFVIHIINQQLVPHGDFKRMSKGVLAYSWRKATPAERKEFEKELKTLVIRTYAAAFKQYRDQTIEFVKLTYSRDKNKVEIATLLKEDGAPDVDISYRLNKTTGGWKVYDLIIENISMVQTYRGQFAERIRNEGIANVIKEMKTLK